MLHQSLTIATDKKLQEFKLSGTLDLVSKLTPYVSYNSILVNLVTSDLTDFASVMDNQTLATTMEKNA